MPIFQLPTNSTKTELLQLKDKLTAFRTVSCKLAHENVLEIYEEDDSDPLDLETMRVLRRGFCSKEYRRVSIGCAHTMANIDFARLADRLQALGVLEWETCPSEVIDQLVLKIYLMDHEVGRLQKKHVLAKRQHTSTLVYETQTEIDRIALQHEKILAELEQIRLNMLAKLDLAINLQR